MNSYFGIINAFLEDTCVIIVMAYLLARGRMLAMLFDGKQTRRRTLLLGATFGLIGLTDVVFPGARYPYVTNTLIITFAAYMVGLTPALLATAIIALFALFFQAPITVAKTLGTDCLSAVIGAGFGSLLPKKSARLAAVIGFCAQTGAVLMLLMDARLLAAPYSVAHSLISIPANGLGMLLLSLVVTDARIRAESDRHRTEAERSNALFAEAQVRALRARIHPHFLFNTLNSIAALCGIAPQKAEAAVLQLGQLMRRSLELNLADPLSIATEMEYVEAYLAIEQHRFGTRLQICKCIDPQCLPVVVPAFAIQTLVENAVNHGLAPSVGKVTLQVAVRESSRGTFIAVVNDGAGITDAARTQSGKADSREHGLQILTAQLRLLHGPRARVRLLRRRSGGTLATFMIPAAASANGLGEPRP